MNTAVVYSVVMWHTLKYEPIWTTNVTSTAMAITTTMTMKTYDNDEWGGVKIRLHLLRNSEFCMVGLLGVGVIKEVGVARPQRPRLPQHFEHCGWSNNNNNNNNALQVLNNFKIHCDSRRFHGQLVIRRRGFRLFDTRINSNIDNNLICWHPVTPHKI